MILFEDSYNTHDNNASHHHGDINHKGDGCGGGIGYSYYGTHGDGFGDGWLFDYSDGCGDGGNIDEGSSKSRWY